MTSYKRMNVVLADDDEDDRELFAEAVSNPETIVTTATNGKELMEMLEEMAELPDCIFLDLNMPEKTGKECLSEIRQNQKFDSVPIIIYSTSSSRRDIDETFALGANLYVVKPGSFKELCYVLNRVLDINWSERKNLSTDVFVYATQ